MPYEPIAGQPQHATEEETMAVIRALLTEDADDKATHAPKTSSAADEQKTENGQNDGLRAFVSSNRDPNPRRRADDLPHIAEAASETFQPNPAGQAARKGGAMSHIVHRLRAFRPSTRQLALVSLALLVVVRPQWFLISGVLLVACLVGFFLILGSDRIWRGVVAHLARVDSRDPVKGAQLRTRLDRFACRWDGILDRFPDGMVDGLYMPDLQEMQSAEAAHADAMAERLERMVHDG